LKFQQPNVEISRNFKQIILIMPLILAQIQDLGFIRETAHPYPNAYKKDIQSSKTHYKRMRIFSDSDTMIVFNHIHYKYDYPSCITNKKDTGIKIYHQKVIGEEAVKYNMERFGF
jgi:hypothetical protein